MTLKDLTIHQLWRVYRRMYSDITQHFSGAWDWPTLWMTYPGKYTLMRDVLDELRSRKQ